MGNGFRPHEVRPNTYTGFPNTFTGFPNTYTGRPNTYTGYAVGAALPAVASHPGGATSFTWGSPQGLKAGDSNRFYAMTHQYRTPYHNYQTMPSQQPLDFSQFSGKTFQLQDPKFQQNTPSFPKQEQDNSRFYPRQEQDNNRFFPSQEQGIPSFPRQEQGIPSFPREDQIQRQANPSFTGQGIGNVQQGIVSV